VCQGQCVAGVAYEDKTRFNQAFTMRNVVAWSGTRRAALGCFYVKRVDGLAFSPPASGWSLGFTYNDTEAGCTAVSAAELCKSNPPPPSKPACEPSTMLVARKRPKRWASKDPDAVYSNFHGVCTRLNVTRVDYQQFQVCLSTVSSPSIAGCRKPVAKAALAGIFFDSAAFSVALPRDLNFENGTIKVATPVCLSSMGGFKKMHGQVDRCGLGPYNNLGLAGKSHLLLDVGLTVVETKAWAPALGHGTATKDWPSTGSSVALGCFYVTGPEEFKPEVLAKVWSVALRYNDVERPSKFNKKKEQHVGEAQVLLHHVG
jgi:hypothetical protein